MFKSIPFRYDGELKREIDLRGLSYLTYKNYRSNLRRISEYIGKDIKEVTIDEAKDYLYYLKNTLHQQPQTINICRSAYIFFNRGYSEIMSHLTCFHITRSCVSCRIYCHLKIS